MLICSEIKPYFFSPKERNNSLELLEKNNINHENKELIHRILNEDFSPLLKFIMCYQFCLPIILIILNAILTIFMTYRIQKITNLLSNFDKDAIKFIENKKVQDPSLNCGVNESEMLEYFNKHYSINFEFYQTLKNTFKLLINSELIKPNYLEIPNVSKKELNIYFIFISLIFVFLQLILFSVFRIVCFMAQAEFRRIFFPEILNSLNKISPYRAANFLYTIVGTMEHFYTNLYQLFLYGFNFIYCIFIFFKDMDSNIWKCLIILWLISLLVVGIILGKMDKKSDIESQIKVIEGASLGNPEMQIFYKYFSNMQKSYDDLISLNRIFKIRTEMRVLYLLLFSTLITSVVIGYAIHNIVNKDNFSKFFIYINMALTMFQFIPDKVAKLINLTTIMKATFLKIKQKEKNYLILNYEEAQKTALEENIECQDFSDINCYLQKKFFGKVIYDKKKKVFFTEKRTRIGKIEKISLQDISFSYDGVKIPSLKNKFNLNVEKNTNEGKLILILGPSGSGKTTILKIILGYLKINGHILINNIPITEIDLDNFYERSILCFQFIKFLPGNLKDSIGDIISDKIRQKAKLINNINKKLFENSPEYRIIKQDLLNPIGFSGSSKFFYNTEDLHKVLILRAIRKAGLEPFVEKMEKGIETNILDNGENLSGGMRQRIAIARMYVKLYYLEILDIKPSVILLDEITASLDENSKLDIIKDIIKIKDKYKVFVFFITHDVNSMQKIMIDKKMKDVFVLFVSLKKIYFDLFETLESNNPEFIKFLHKKKK